MFECDHVGSSRHRITRQSRLVTETSPDLMEMKFRDMDCVVRRESAILAFCSQQVSPISSVFSQPPPHHTHTVRRTHPDMTTESWRHRHRANSESRQRHVSSTRRESADRSPFCLCRFGAAHPVCVGTAHSLFLCLCLNLSPPDTTNVTESPIVSGTNTPSSRSVLTDITHHFSHGEMCRFCLCVCVALTICERAHKL